MKKKYEKPLTLEELAALPDSAIDTSDIPVLDEAFWSKAVVTAPRTKPNVSLRIDEDEIADESEVIGGGKLRGAVGGTDGIDDFQLDFPAGAALVFLGEGADAIQKRRGTAEDHCPFHRIRAGGNCFAAEVVFRRRGERVIGTAGEVRTCMVLGRQVIHKYHCGKEKEDLSN